MIITIAAAALAAPAAFGGGGATVVQGVQTPVTAGPCYDPGAVVSYTMEGGLVGCWSLDTFLVRDSHPSGTEQAFGTEHFAGCLDLNGNGTCDPGEPAGTFGTTYTFTSKDDPSGNEIHGRCHHPIQSGTGGFAGATGEVEFTDDVTTGVSYYHGTITP